MAHIPTENLKDNSVDGILANAGNPSVLIPDDDYTAVWVSSELKDTKNGGKMLVFKAVITEGQYANTELFETTNIIGVGEKKDITEKIAYETLARMAKAIGRSTIPTDSRDLHNKKFKLRTKTELQKDWNNNQGETVKGTNKTVIDSRGYAALPTVNIPQDAPFDNEPSPSQSAKMPWEQ